MAGKLQIPTGFESLQQKAQSRRTLAEKMQALGLQNNQNYHSWTQVLAQLADAWAGRGLEKDADKLDSEYRMQLLNAYSKAHGDFNAAVSAGKTPEQLRAQFGNNPYTEDDLKLYTPGITKGVEKQAENANTYVPTPDRGYQSLPSQIGRVPFDPNKTVVSVDNGKSWATNPVKITADRLAQGTGPTINAVNSMSAPGMQSSPPTMPPQGPGVPPAPPPPDPYYSPAPAAGGLPFTPSSIGGLESNNRDFMPNGAPVTSPAGAKFGMQVMPSTAHAPGFGVRPAASDTAAEYDRVGRDYAQAMLRRYHGDPVKAAAGYNGGPGRTDQALAASGSGFLSHMPAETQAYASHFAGGVRPPDGKTIDGRDYWMVNGMPYDNPEGK